MKKSLAPRRPRGTTDIRLPTLPAIRAFEAAARLGSIERASEELALTASAVGKRIAALEGQLGVKLLTRRGRGVTPTAAGLEYAEQVSTALGLLSSVCLHQRQPRRMQHLRVCAPPTFSRQVLIPHLAGFAREHPGIELELAVSVPYLGLRPPADVEIIAVPSHAAVGEILLDERLRPVCAPDYARRVGPLHRPPDLARATLLRCPLEAWRPWFAAAGLDWREPASGPQLVDMGLAIEAAASGLGVALARPSLTRRAVDRGELIFLFDIASPAATLYSMQISASAELKTPAEAFAGWLREICGTLMRQQAD